MSFQEIDRNSILEDEHQQRLRRIKLIERETKEQAPLWAAKQATLFPTALPLTQTPTLGQVITEETQKNAFDIDILYQRAEQKLKTIADNTNVQYILDRLTDEQLYYLVNAWDAVLKTLKEKYTTSGLDKNVFITMIEKEAQNITPTPTIAMNSRGDLRAQQKIDLENEQQAKVDAERTQLENEKLAFDAEVNQRQQDKEAEDLRQQEQQKRQALLKKLKKNRILASLKNSANKIPPMQSSIQQPSVPTPQPVSLPTISSKTTTFVFDPTKDNLSKKWEDEFNVKFDSIKQIINQLDPDVISDAIVDLEINYPNKMLEMPFASEKNILIDFYMRELLDEAYEQELAENKPLSALERFNRSTQNSPYEVDKKQFQKMVIFDLKEYAKNNNIKITGKRLKEDIIKAILDAKYNVDAQKYKGKGLKKVIYGKGYTSSDEDEQPVRKNTVLKKVINGKYIDLNKLKNNILTVRYVKTGGFIPTVKSQHISNDVKSVIEDLISDKFEKRLFEKLQPDEKRLVKRLVAALKIDIDVNTKEDDEYRKQFEIVLGEFQAGNTSPAIKNKLKQYVAESMQSGFLTRRECWQLLYELTINN
jgi:hypothetical protein